MYSAVVTQLQHFHYKANTKSTKTFDIFHTLIVYNFLWRGEYILSEFRFCSCWSRELQDFKFTLHKSNHCIFTHSGSTAKSLILSELFTPAATFTAKHQHITPYKCLKSKSPTTPNYNNKSLKVQCATYLVYFYVFTKTIVT